MISCLRLRKPSEDQCNVIAERPKYHQGFCQIGEGYSDSSLDLSLQWISQVS